jgi:hypothetical protein
MQPCLFTRININGGQYIGPFSAEVVHGVQMSLSLADKTRLRARSWPYGAILHILAQKVEHVNRCTLHVPGHEISTNPIRNTNLPFVMSASC